LINSPHQLKALVVTSSLFPTQPDFLFNSLHLKDTCKEDQHYKVVDEDVWAYLYSIYGGKAIQRYSIEVQTDQGTEFLIEVFLRRFTTLGYPRVKYVNVND
jgi:hypothetical protein